MTLQQTKITTRRKLRPGYGLRKSRGAITPFKWTIHYGAIAKIRLGRYADAKASDLSFIGGFKKLGLYAEPLWKITIPFLPRCSCNA